MKIQIGSLDLFWMPQLAEALEKQADCELLSTWSPMREPPARQSRNAWALHYSLSIYKRFPRLQAGNHAYYILCRLFDHWLARQIQDDVGVLYFLSGCGDKAMDRVQSRSRLAVVESGSTHTDFQHEIVWEEYKRNGLSAPLFPEKYRSRVRRELEKADFVQIPSHFVKRTYIERGVPESKILLASYGADISGFTCRTKDDVSPCFRAICPSGVNLRKGARVLAEAWHKLGWREREAELHWIGWPDHPDVRHLFGDTINGIVWHGWMKHEELGALYRSCDVLVLPSFEEGLARVLIEAGASGLPPIATPNTGVEDFFTPKDPEGWLIPVNDVDALCEALAQARANREGTFLLGQRAATRARESFSWEHYGAQVRTNFRMMMESR